MATYPGRDSAGFLRFAGWMAGILAFFMGGGLYEANQTFEAGGDVSEIRMIAMLAVGAQAVFFAAFCFAIAASAENTAVLREEVDKIRDELKQAHASIGRVEERTYAKLPS
jgi:hypothetical protein